jgi:membrane-associated phospholipid phosphatase
MNAGIRITLVLLLLGIGLSYFAVINIYVLHLVNGAYPNERLWVAITTLGDKLFVGCLLFVCLRNNLYLLTNALLGGLLVHLAAQGGKRFFTVVRPEYVTDHIIRFGAAIPSDNYGMPSGHTMTAFMALIFLIRHYSLSSWKLALAIGVALLAGISRMSVGAHWPADCFVGAALGMLIAILLTTESVQIKFIGIRPITYLIYSIFIIFSIKTIFHVAPSIEHILVGAIGVCAFIFWISDAYKIIAARQWH